MQCLRVCLFFGEGSVLGGVKIKRAIAKIQRKSKYYIALPTGLPGLNKNPSVLICLFCFDFFDHVQQDPFIRSRLPLFPCWTLKNSDSYITNFLNTTMAWLHKWIGNDSLHFFHNFDCNLMVVNVHTMLNDNKLYKKLDIKPWIVESVWSLLRLIPLLQIHVWLWNLQRTWLGF